MNWKQYALALLMFNTLGALAVYGLQRLQAYLPWNPQQMSAVSADSSFNTAVSFATNTNWQGYGGETTMSYLTQMLALAVQNFVSAATGMAVLVALIRGFALKQAQQIGNFWVDLTRSTLYILLPLSIVLAVVLVGQGVVQTFRPYETVTLVKPITVAEPVTDAAGNPVKDEKGNPETKPVKVDTQTIPLGPAACQIAIKQLGTNGGGFFNVNSAHPFENPTPLSNFLELLAILLIPAALCYTLWLHGRRHAPGLGAARGHAGDLCVPLLGLTAWAEGRSNPAYPAAVAQAASAQQSGGNMEGKETRFGIANSALWAAATTAASNGSVNSMHDSYTPLGGLIPMWLMQLGEVIFGGVGSGLYGMLVFAIIAVFIAGLMVGRTPEYLGKKIEAFEMKMAALVILIPPFFALVLHRDRGVAGGRPRRHRQSRAARLLGDSLRLLIGGRQQRQRVRRLVGQYAVLQHAARHCDVGVALLADRSRCWPSPAALAAKKRVPAGAGTLPTHTPLFVVLLASTVLMVGALAFFPALALGPIVEELQFLAH